jgi:spore coat polysaccharide biosynthesis protein SpsF (cytidylyltransferase family)/uncharacterized protein YlzI (FlbEa/FlbD family)
MKLRTVAIIQARMGSSRLPGKVMMPLGNESILEYLCGRISKARTLDSLIVATTIHERDDIIIDECKRIGIAHFRGDEYDVLGRYVAAAEASGAEIIVRVTADNPFTDPGSIDRVVEHIVFHGADYSIETNVPLGTTGEALTRNALHLIDRFALFPRWREHVTLFAKAVIDRRYSKQGVRSMIIVKKINQQEIIVNCDLIETIEFNPHAVMLLTSGEKIVVDETREELLRKIIEYKRAIHHRQEALTWI